MQPFRFISRTLRWLARAASVLSLLLGALSILAYYRAPTVRDGLLYGNAGGRLFTFATTDDRRFKFMIDSPWPVHQALTFARDPEYIGTSGMSASTDYFQSYPRWNILVEKGAARPFMAADDVTPLLHSAAQHSNHAALTPIHFYLILFPIQLAILATAILPSLHVLGLAAAAILKTRRRKRAALNLCPTCSYDLRAHHPGDNCPECGTPIPIAFQPAKEVPSCARIQPATDDFNTRHAAPASDNSGLP